MALFKKVSAATLALLMTASAVSASAAGTKILLTSEIGDADNNGAINTLDYVTMEEYIVNRSKSAQQDADYNFLYNADYNFDEKTDVADVALLVKVMLEGKQASALTADEAAEAFEAMKANYIKLEKSGVKSELKTSYNGAKENTTTTILLKNDTKYHATADSSEVADQDIYVDLSGSTADIYTKGSDDKFTKEQKLKNSSVIRKLVGEIVKNSQFAEQADMPSLSVVELIFASSTKANFENSYSYVDANGNKYIMVPVADFIQASGDVKDIAGSYMIEMDKNNNPLQIRVVKATSSIGDDYAIEDGRVKFITDEDELAALGIDFKLPSVEDSNTDPSDKPSTDPSDKPSTDPSVNPSTDPSVNPSTDPSVNPSTDPSVNPSTDPSVNPSTPADPFEEGKEVEDSIYDILTKSAKYLAKAEYSVIDFETDETVVNNGVSYKNEAKGQAVRSGKNVKATVENGKFTYNDGTEDVFDYSGAKAYAFYNGNGEADVYANATLVNGKDNTLTTEWLYKKASKSIADDTAALKNDANTVYNNVLKELIDKKVKELGENLTLERLNEIQNEVKATEAEADKVKADFEEKANALQTRADKLKADADALQARVDALQAQIDKADANTDTEALENEKTSISADRDRFTAEKESLLKDKKDLEDQAEAKKKEFEAKRDSILEELGGASLEETKAKVEKLQKEKEAFENFQKNAVEQAKAQFDITAPSKAYLQDMLKGDNSAKNRINNNSKVVEVPGTENQIKIVTDAAAIADTKGEFMKTPTGKVQYIVEKNKLADGTFEYVPVKIEVLEGSTVKSTDKNSVTATVTKTVIDFKFPTTTEVKFTDEEKAEIAKSTTDPFEFIKKDKFTKFVAKFAENKANVK